MFLLDLQLCNIALFCSVKQVKGEGLDIQFSCCLIELAYFSSNAYPSDITKMDRSSWIYDFLKV